MKTGKEATIESIIKGCIKGDRKCQQTLFKSFYSKMLNVCMRYSNNPDEAKDILQEGFIKVFDNLKGFECKGSFEGWIKKIMVNCAIDCIRKKHMILLDINDANVSSPDREEDIGEIDYSRYSKVKPEMIMTLIQKLSPMYRAVFNLYVLEDCSHKEIAETLNISIGSSKSNLSKARQNLKKLIDTYSNEHIRQIQSV